MELKIASMTEKLKQQFGFVPVSHRAGRWAMNDTYYDLLYKYGYEIDCSITPGINWTSSLGGTPGFKGPDYSKASSNVTIKNHIIEVPVTVKYVHKAFFSSDKTCKENVKTLFYGVKGKNIWIRPDGSNYEEMSWLVEQCILSDTDYLMFMIHSSELMPGGSPTFKSEKDIEKLYLDIEKLFKKICSSYEGITLQNYVKKRVENNNINI